MEMWGEAAAVRGRAAPPFLPIQTAADAHNAGTSVCNKPISCLRVHARACTVQAYALAQARKSPKVDGPCRVSPHERLRVRRAEKSLVEESEIFFRKRECVKRRKHTLQESTPTTTNPQSALTHLVVAESGSFYR